MLAVLDLDVREVLGRGPVHVHSASGEECEVDGVRGSEHVEALPVRIGTAIAATDRGEESFGRRVGADDECDIAEAGQDLRASRIEGLRAGGTRRVAAADPNTAPTEFLGERRAGDEAGIAVADGVGAGHVLHVFPFDARVGQGGPGGDHSVLGEVTTPFAPRVHADPENCDVLTVGRGRGGHPFTGAQT